MKTGKVLQLLILLTSTTFAQSIIGKWKPCGTIDKNGKYLKLLPKAVYDAEIAKQKKIKGRESMVSMLEINKILSNGFQTSVGVTFNTDSTCYIKSAGYIDTATYVVNASLGQINVTYKSNREEIWKYFFTKSKELKISNFKYDTTFYFKKY